MLRFRSSPDFEVPHDDNLDNVYTITVRASDGRLATSVHVTVTVADVNERPVADLAITDQTMTVGVSRIISLQGTFSDPDTNDTLTYTASTSPSGIATASVSNSDSTLTIAALSAGSATITVTAADRSLGHADRLTVSQDFTVTVEETNVPPTFDEGPRTTRSVAENTPSSNDVGSPVAASDDDNDTMTYELSGTDAGSFTIVDESGQIRTSDSLNFETKNSYSVTVTADDGNGGTDSINVTINIIDVNEAPVGKPIADRTLAGGVLSREIDLSRYFSDPDTNDTLTYTAETPDTSVATVSVDGSALTLERVSAGKATITVTAADRSLDHADRLTASRVFKVTVEAPALPTVTIETLTPDRSEGQSVVFRLTVSPAPTAAITVIVSVTESGSFLTDESPADIDIDEGTMTARLHVQTENDAADEANGTVTVTIRPGIGYRVGNPSSASATVHDNDPPPPAPTGLRANGHLVSGNVKLRWAPVSGATGYKVQYSEVQCVQGSLPGRDEDVICNLEDSPMWNRIMASDFTTEEITIAGTAVVEATVGGLTRRKLYRVEVQAVIAEASDWSDFTLVFPTSSSPSHGPHYGFIFSDHVLDRSNGSREYRYSICEDTITTDVAWDWSTEEHDDTVTAVAADIASAIGTWGTNVRWVTNVMNGANIVSSTVMDTDICPGRNAVKFIEDDDVEVMCDIPKPETLGCFVEESLGILLRHTPLRRVSDPAQEPEKFEPTRWEEMKNGCSYLYKIVMHEAGHVFGLSHPRSPQGVMYGQVSGWLGRFCEPQPHDIVGMIAKYQSQ